MKLKSLKYCILYLMLMLLIEIIHSFLIKTYTTNAYANANANV